MKPTMEHPFRGALALAAASVLVLGGCAKTEEKGPMEKAGAAADRAVEKVRTASTDAVRSVSEAAEKAKDAAATAAASIGTAAEKAKAGAAEMTATAGAAVEKAGQKVGAAAEKSAEKAKTAVSTAATPKK